MIKKGWAVEHCKHQGVHIDIQKRQIKINKKKYWLVFETKEIIHLYGYVEENKDNLTEEKLLDQILKLKKH